MTNPRPAIAVVGAGLAGLAAACELTRRGFDVAVFERESHPGGRARSEKVEGFTLEAVGQLVSGGDRRLLAWIDAVGISDELLPLRPVLTMLATGGKLATVESDGLIDIARTPGIRPREALRLIRLPRLIARYGDRLVYDEPERGASLDDRSLGDFGRLYFGSSVLSHWLAPRVTETSLGRADDLSRVLFLRRFRLHGNARAGLLRSGVGELSEKAASGLAVTYRAEVERIESGPAGRISFDVNGGTRALSFSPDAVVVATSAPEARRIAAPSLVTAESESLADVRYHSAISLAVGLRRPFHSHPQHIQLPHGEGSPLESVLLEPGVTGGRVPDGRGLALLRATGAFSAASFDTPEEALVKELMAAFARIRPGAESAVMFTKLFRVERALPCFDVGRYRAIANFERVQRELRGEGRRLYFTGDYLMDPSLEGAVASAHRVAAAVAEDLSEPA
jgi:oxygen-dependent protoporphyrinogen oxidase